MPFKTPRREPHKTGSIDDLDLARLLAGAYSRGAPLSPCPPAFRETPLAGGPASAYLALVVETIGLRGYRLKEHIVQLANLWYNWANQA